MCRDPECIWGTKFSFSKDNVAARKMINVTAWSAPRTVSIWTTSTISPWDVASHNTQTDIYLEQTETIMTRPKYHQSHSLKLKLPLLAKTLSNRTVHRKDKGTADLKSAWSEISFLPQQEIQRDKKEAIVSLFSGVESMTFSFLFPFSSGLSYQ